MTLDWQVSANCATTDPDLFFPESNEHGLAAKKICAACEVRPACLAYALETRQHTGVWGGTTAAQRTAMRRNAA